MAAAAASTTEHRMAVAAASTTEHRVVLLAHAQLPQLVSKQAALPGSVVLLQRALNP
jgi:hypothetical protein